MNEEDAGQILEQERQRNQIIEEIINRFRGQDAMLNQVLS